MSNREKLDQDLSIELSVAVFLELSQQYQMSVKNDLGFIFELTWFIQNYTRTKRLRKNDFDKKVERIKKERRQMSKKEAGDE